MQRAYQIRVEASSNVQKQLIHSPRLVAEVATPQRVKQNVLPNTCVLSRCNDSYRHFSVRGQGDIRSRLIDLRFRWHEIERRLHDSIAISRVILLGVISAQMVVEGRRMSDCRFSR